MVECPTLEQKLEHGNMVQIVDHPPLGAWDLEVALGVPLFLTIPTCHPYVLLHGERNIEKTNKRYQVGLNVVPCPP